MKYSLFFIFLFPSCAFAACDMNSFESVRGFIADYEGHVGQSRVRISVSFEDEDPKTVKGVYMYAPYFQNIHLDGTFDESGGLFLNERAPDGTVSAHFKGAFSGEECQDFKGTWQKEGAAKKIPFQVRFIDSSEGPLVPRYEDIIDRNAVKFWWAVKKDDRKTVSALMDYPLTYQDGGREIIIKDKQQFLEMYDAIFSKQYKQAIERAFPGNMYYWSVTSSGARFGNRGEAWFNSDGKITVLRN